jgi:hypothetical protein
MDVHIYILKIIEVYVHMIIDMHLPFSKHLSYIKMIICIYQYIMYIKLFTLLVYSFHRNGGIYCIYIYSYQFLLHMYTIAILYDMWTYVYIYIFKEPKLICVNTYYTYTYRCVRTTPFVVHESMICLIYTLCVICLKKNAGGIPHRSCLSCKF